MAPASGRETAWGTRKRIRVRPKPEPDPSAAAPKWGERTPEGTLAWLVLPALFAALGLLWVALGALT